MECGSSDSELVGCGGDGGGTVWVGLVREGPSDSLPCRLAV